MKYEPKEKLAVGRRTLEWVVIGKYITVLANLGLIECSVVNRWIWVWKDKYK